MTVDTNNLRYLPRRSSRNYDLQFDNDVDRLKENDVIFEMLRRVVPMR